MWAKRRLEHGEPWPDLLLIDGGRGQLAAVDKILREELATDETEGRLPFLLAGIAKARDERGHADRRAGNVADRIFVPGRSNPLPLREGCPELLFLQVVRDAAHDFSIGRHRQARAKQAFSGELQQLRCCRLRQPQRETGPPALGTLRLRSRDEERQPRPHHGTAGHR